MCSVCCMCKIQNSMGNGSDGYIHKYMKFNCMKSCPPIRPTAVFWFLTFVIFIGFSSDFAKGRVPICRPSGEQKPTINLVTPTPSSLEIAKLTLISGPYLEWFQLEVYGAILFPLPQYRHARDTRQCHRIQTPSDIRYSRGTTDQRMVYGINCMTTST